MRNGRGEADLGARAASIMIPVQCTGNCKSSQVKSTALYINNRQPMAAYRMCSPPPERGASRPRGEMGGVRARDG